VIALRCVVAAVYLALLASGAAAETVVLSGIVHAASGRPIAGAIVTLRAGRTEHTVTTDADGRFRVAIDEARATLSATAPGYAPGGARTVTASSHGEIDLTLTAVPPTIGTIAALPAATPFPAAPLTADVAARAAFAAGALRTGDALAVLPGFSRIGQGSSNSDDLYLSLRGFKPSEVLTLLDGHPIGPLGVSPDMAAGFDYQNSPLFALRAATVTYGSGPSGAYAYDALVGSVDLQTLDPTRAVTAAFAQTAGGQARSSSVVASTGTAGAVGYAVAYGVQGTSGNFSPQTIAQTGLRGSDFTSTTLAALTYPVSANAILRNGLAKIRVPLGNAASLTFTSFSATSWVDKTGVDDNDFYPYAFELAQAQQNLGGSLTPGGDRCAPALVPVIDDAHPSAAHPACITPGAFAAGASGPAGGGPGAYQSIVQTDNAVHAAMPAGAHTIDLDAFIDRSATDLVRPASFVQSDADDTLTGTLTSGFFARDAVPIGATAFTAGISSVVQRFQVDGAPGVVLGENSAFASLRATPAAHLTVSATTMVKHFTALAQTVVDPQVVLAYQPSAADTLRVLAGAATFEPSAAALGGLPQLMSAGDVDPGNCRAFTIGSAPNGAVTGERAADAEASFSHRFGRIGTLGISAYATSLRGQIFGAGTPLGAIPGYTAGSPGLGAFYDRVRSICPGDYGAATDAQIFAALSVEQPLNAARALSRGIDLNGRLNLAPGWSVSALYTIDSTRRFDLPDAVLALPANATIVDGGQVAGIPVHQASLTIARVSARGLSGTLAAYYQGPNNQLNLPGYAYADLALHAPLGHGLRLDVAVTNLFNSHADIYGRVGLGLFQPENQFGTDGNAIEQATERYGLSPATIAVTLSQLVGR
jgi:hypothetical protein